MYMRQPQNSTYGVSIVCILQQLNRAIMGSLQIVHETLWRQVTGDQVTGDHSGNIILNHTVAVCGCGNRTWKYVKSHVRSTVNASCWPAKGITCHKISITCKVTQQSIYDKIDYILPWERRQWVNVLIKGRLWKERWYEVQISAMFIPEGPIEYDNFYNVSVLNRIYVITRIYHWPVDSP